MCSVQPPTTKNHFAPQETGWSYLLNNPSDCAKSGSGSVCHLNALRASRSLQGIEDSDDDHIPLGGKRDGNLTLLRHCLNLFPYLFFELGRDVDERAVG